MSEYYCKPCDYKTDRYNNFVRHTNSLRHHENCGTNDVTDETDTNVIVDNNNLNNINILGKDYDLQTIITRTVMAFANIGNQTQIPIQKEIKKPTRTVRGSGVYVCKYCGKEFADKNSKYYHQSKCGELLANNDNNFDKAKMTKNDICKIYEKQLKEKDKQINQLLETNVNTAKATADVAKTSVVVSESTNKSMSMMTYAMKYFKDAPVLKQLEKSQVKEIIEYTGSVNSYDDIFEYVEDILFEFKKGRIMPYLGNLIGTHFGVDVPYMERPVWATDVSRLSFIVMQHVETGKEWSADKSGKKFTDLVINPTLNFINNLLKKFIDMEGKNQDEYYREFDKNQKKCEKIMELRSLAVKFMSEILTSKFKKELLKLIAPYFNFDTKRMNVEKEIESKSTMSVIKTNIKMKKKSSESNFSDDEINNKADKMSTSSSSVIKNNNKPKKIPKKFK